MTPEMTDIHDIRPVLPPDFLPLIIGLVVIFTVILLFVRQLLKYLQKRKPPAPQKEQKFVEGYKQITLKELHAIKIQLENDTSPDISYYTSRVHHVIKWYLSNKLQKRLTSGTLTEIMSYIPQTFSPIITFCYSVIFPWQKRSKDEVLEFIQTSINTVTHDT